MDLANSSWSLAEGKQLHGLAWWGRQLSPMCESEAAAILSYLPFSPSDSESLSGCRGRRKRHRHRHCAKGTVGLMREAQSSVVREEPCVLQCSRQKTPSPCAANSPMPGSHGFLPSQSAANPHTWRRSERLSGCVVVPTKGRGCAQWL